MLAILILLGAHIFKTQFDSIKLTYKVYPRGGDTRSNYRWGADQQNPHSA